MTSRDEVVFVINPGSTSTKLACFSGENESRREVIRLSPRSSGESLWAQFDDRLRIAREWFSKEQESPSAVVGLGGLLKPLAGGTYRVTQTMIEDARANLQGEHASNLGCVLASDIAQAYGCPAYVVDPVSVDEFEPVARYSGHPAIERKSLSHALSIHAAARKAAGSLGVPLASSSLIVVHMGGGISVAPVKNGRIVDVNDASSDGPFSPERTGGLPLQQFISACYSNGMTEQEARSFVMGKGGLLAYLGTTTAEEVEKRIQQGDAAARSVFEAMAYQISKEIGAMATVLAGNVKAIVLTGGLANSSLLVSWISERVRFIAPVLHFPGEFEMEALALGALRVLRGEEQPKEY